MHTSYINLEGHTTTWTTFICTNLLFTIHVYLRHYFLLLPYTFWSHVRMHTFKVHVYMYVMYSTTIYMYMYHFAGMLLPLTLLL